MVRVSEIGKHRRHSVRVRVCLYLLPICDWRTAFIHCTSHTLRHSVKYVNNNWIYYLSVVFALSMPYSICSYASSYTHTHTHKIYTSNSTILWHYLHDNFHPTSCHFRLRLHHDFGAAPSFSLYQCQIDDVNLFDQRATCTIFCCCGHCFCCQYHHHHFHRCCSCLYLILATPIATSSWFFDLFVWR